MITIVIHASCHDRDIYMYPCVFPQGSMELLKQTINNKLPSGCHVRFLQRHGMILPIQGTIQSHGISHGDSITAVLTYYRQYPLQHSPTYYNHLSDELDQEPQNISKVCLLL